MQIISLYCLNHKRYTQEMQKGKTINCTNTKGHAFYFYHSNSERFQVVAEYFQQGIHNHELCVFVTPDSLEDIKRNFISAGFNVQNAISSGILCIFAMDQTYLPNGRFASDYMLHNVSTFIKESKDQGYSGLRTAGDMRWLGEHSEYLEEARLYEHDVNTLNESNPDFIGLCLYPIEDNFSEALEGAIQTHPTFIFGGRAHINPAYATV